MLHITLCRAERLAPRVAVARRGRGAIMADGFRFAWENQVTFDFRAPDRIEYVPGPDWKGCLPESFFSTVAALALAWNNRLPLHATAIEWQGRAYLLAGKAGAGKSTLAAELLNHGARLIGDDLTMLDRGGHGGTFAVLPGRPAMRLHPATAETIQALSCEPVPEDLRGKLLVRPAARCVETARPLGGVLLMGEVTGRLSPLHALRLLPSHQFRPRWLKDIPGDGTRKAWLIELASTVPVHGLPSISGFDTAARDIRIAMALSALG